MKNALRSLGMGRALAVCVALGACAPPALADSPTLPVGTWSDRGDYRPPRRRARFARLHGAAAAPRYPVVLVHGIVGWNRARLGPFFMDYFNGIREELKSMGVPSMATQQTSFASIEQRAAQVKQQVLAFMAETGAEKVNLVAHSMGGLDCRYLVSRLEMGEKVASLTTVSSPHHGSWYADFAVDWIFDKQRFEKVWRWLGIPYDAVPQMTTRYLAEDFNPNTPNHPDVRYFSFSGDQPYWKMMPPLSSMGLIMRVIERRLAGQKVSLKDRWLAKLVMPKATRRRLAAGTDSLPGWVRPELVGKNDGIIPTSSAIWGEHQVTLDADHFNQLGWFGTFKARRFYRNLCRMLADAGF